jgi:hypothetical protein
MSFYILNAAGMVMVNDIKDSAKDMALMGEQKAQ